MGRKYIDSFSVRHGMLAKNKFLKEIKNDVEALGYETNMYEKRMRLSKVRHLIVGNIKNAKKLVIVPYDTPTQVFWPKYKYYPMDGDMQLQKQFLPTFVPMIVGYVGLLALVYIFPDLLGETFKVPLYYFSIFYFMFLLAFIVLGFANKNNVNRNSASICMALDLMEKLDVRKRKETAFVFMDSYIMKGYGGQVLASYLESVQKNPMKICLNCIACGEEVCVGFSKGMRKDAQTLAKAYKGNKKIQTKTIQDAQKMHTPFDSLNDVINVSCGSFEEENFVVYNTASKKDTYLEEENYTAILEMMIAYLQM